MSETVKSKGKGPKAVIEMEPAEEQEEPIGAQEGATASPDADEPAADGQSAPSAAVATVGFIRRLGWRIWNYSEENPNTVFYTLVGLAFAILILTLGIWRALVIGVCMAIGAVYGQVRDGKNGIVNFFIDLIEGNNR